MICSIKIKFIVLFNGISLLSILYFLSTKLPFFYEVLLEMLFLTYFLTYFSFCLYLKAKLIIEVCHKFCVYYFSIKPILKVSHKSFDNFSCILMAILYLNGSIKMNFSDFWNWNKFISSINRFLFIVICNLHKALNGHRLFIWILLKKMNPMTFIEKFPKICAFESMICT